MTKHEELERLARAAIADNDNPDMWASVESLDAMHRALTPEVVLALLSANREMREAASLVLETNDRIVDAMLAAKDERTAASISLKGSDEFTATLAVLRSALTTQRGDGE